MNKQELIKKIKNLPFVLLSERYISQNYVLELLEQLDEPQKPVVPQFVAEWYEEHKKDLGYSIWNYIYYWDQQEGYDFKDWFDYGCCGTIQTLFNMHQFGYEVEEEKRYIVRLKNIREDRETLNCEKRLKIWNFSSEEETTLFRTKHTRKQLEEAGFGWVFDCEGVEVEEVEE
jgi:hypothetical protein